MVLEKKHTSTEVTKHSDVPRHKTSSGVTSVVQALTYHAGVMSEMVFFTHLHSPSTVSTSFS